ncbi:MULTISPECIES: hypothetical protein [unclassified Dyella]|uniref:hypothetical protein n=1 Tax=unclassified Dyella TaxID=2634549 RepID=UPI0013042D09|nr:MULTISPECIES: hypothetical protein [unclassified Dyella]MDR3446734.1 hypothetical protein [Dyella sp.]
MDASRLIVATITVINGAIVTTSVVVITMRGIAMTGGGDFNHPLVFSLGRAMRPTA